MFFCYIGIVQQSIRNDIYFPAVKKTDDIVLKFLNSHYNFLYLQSV